MLAVILNRLDSELAKIEKEYHLYDFKQPGVMFTFATLTNEILNYNRILCLIMKGIDLKKDVSLQIAFSQNPNYYIPTKKEILENGKAAQDFVNRSNVLFDKYQRDCLAGKDFLTKLTELTKDGGNHPLAQSLVTTPPKPTAVPQLEASNESSNQNKQTLGGFKKGFLQ